MISFDVKSLFTNVPLEKTIDIILRKVYVEKKIKTDIPKAMMNQLLLLCTKHVHFTFNNVVYIQNDGVAMGSPLGPLLANIFMTELEETIIPTLKNDLKHWKRYVDDTHAYINPRKINSVMTKLNSFHEKIQFTYELETNNKLPFLDVLVTRSDDNKIETTVYRKPTNTDIYINWNEHAPIEWKKSTLKTLIRRAKSVCSTEKLLQDEIKHLKDVFCNLNNYPKQFVKRIINELFNDKDKKDETSTLNDQDKPKEDMKQLQLTLPYSGKKGTHLMSKMKKHLQKQLPDNVKTRIAYKCKKLSTRFQIKDKTNFPHKNNVVYKINCPERDCTESYVGETKRRIQERIIDHNNRDKNSRVLKHSRETNHHHVWQDNFTIIGSNYKSDFKRKISEALFIKRHKPSLNSQVKHYNLKLFN